MGSWRRPRGGVGKWAGHSLTCWGKERRHLPSEKGEGGDGQEGGQGPVTQDVLGHGEDFGFSCKCDGNQQRV